MKNRIGKFVAVAALIAASPVYGGIKEGDVNIGVTAAGQLRGVYFGGPVELPEINGPLFGWGDIDPGFFSIENPIPAEGLFVPANGANIVLQVIAFAPALKGWTPGFASVFNDPAEIWNIGPVPFDEHAFWHIDSNDPGFVPPPIQTQWSATFRLLDTGSTGYLPSDPVTLTFVPVPEPTSLSLLAIGALFLAMRSRRPSTVC